MTFTKRLEVVLLEYFYGYYCEGNLHPLVLLSKKASTVNRKVAL